MGTPSTAVPATHWYSSVFHFLKHIGVYVSDAFVALFGSDAAHNFAVGAESILKTDLGKIVMTAVQEASNLATGAEKKAAAFAAIATQAKASGIEMKDSLVNMLIELAVSRMKGVFGATP